LLQKTTIYTNLLRELIISSRKIVYQTANFQMVETYWRIDEKIVEEQGGRYKACKIRRWTDCKFIGKTDSRIWQRFFGEKSACNAAILLALPKRLSQKGILHVIARAKPEAKRHCEERSDEAIH
jgi:hypothetical protein